MFGLFKKKDKECCDSESKMQGGSCSTEAKDAKGSCDTKPATKPEKEMKDGCCGGGCH